MVQSQIYNVEVEWGLGMIDISVQGVICLVKWVVHGLFS